MYGVNERVSERERERERGRQREGIKSTEKVNERI